LIEGAQLSEPACENRQARMKLDASGGIEIHIAAKQPWLVTGV
jgi:hypothetical protein